MVADVFGIRNHTFWLETDEEKKRPEAWRYWRALPGKGEMAVFFGGWYSEPVRKFCCGGLDENDFNRRMQRWARLERALAASGTLIVKFWLHIGKKAHKERLVQRLKHKGHRSFTPYDKKSEENYDALVSAAAKAITITDRAYAPWTLIDAFDANFRNVAVTRALTAALSSAVAARKTLVQDAPVVTTQVCPEGSGGPERDDAAAFSALDAVDLGNAREHSEYKKKLAALQEDIYALTYKAWKHGISSTLVFEGWDAAGKGGAIRRLTAGMDARIVRVIPISAPTDEELAHHYLWRFWRHVPMAGFVTVYDRSWYGRVLVERVEGLTPSADWKRAYAEINDFEAQLREPHNIVVKYWLHISREEQLRAKWLRHKQYKITGQDWRNRENSRLLHGGAEEMFARTSAGEAPWHIVPAEVKICPSLDVLHLSGHAEKSPQRIPGKVSEATGPIRRRIELFILPRSLSLGAQLPHAPLGSVPQLSVADNIPGFHLWRAPLPQHGQRFVRSDPAIAARVLQIVFRAIPQLHAVGARAFKQVGRGPAAEAQHLPGQIPDFMLGVAAAADGEPVQQGVGVHADDGFEFRGLRLQIAQVFLGQSGFQPGFIPLAGQLGQIPAAERGRAAAGQGYGRGKFRHLARIDHGEAPFTVELRPARLDEVGGQTLAHQLGLGHARVARHAEEKIVEFQGRAMPAG